MARRREEETGERVSMRKENRSKGGALPGKDGIFAKIVKAVYRWFDYGGKAEKQCGLFVEFESEEEGFEKFDQFYSAGKKMRPSANGEYLVAESKDVQFNENTKLAQFLDSLEEAGIEEDVIDGDASGLADIEGTWKRAPDKSDDKGKRDILLLEELSDGKKKSKKKKAKPEPEEDEEEEEEDDEEDEKPAKKKKPAKKDEDEEEDEDEDDDGEEEEEEEAPKKKKAGAADSGGGDKALTKKLVKTVSAIVHEKANKKGINVEDKLGQLVFKALNGDDDRKKIMPMITDDDDMDTFLTKHAEVGEWEYDDGVIKPA